MKSGSVGFRWRFPKHIPLKRGSSNLKLNRVNKMKHAKKKKKEKEKTPV